MANRICILRGAIKFTDPCSPAVVEALRVFTTHAEQSVARWQFPHPEIEIGAGELRLALHVRGRPGYRSDSIEEFVSALCPLSVEGSHLELRDTEYPDGDPQLYWVGPDESERNLAEARYGLALAHEYLAAAIGERQFAEIESVVLSLAARARTPADGS